MRRRAPATLQPLPRLRRLLIGRNPLRRRSDRLEMALVLALVAVFIVAAAAAVALATRVWTTERSAAAKLRPAVAMLTANGPGNAAFSGGGIVPARWRAPDGRPLAGPLTTLTAPAITGAAAGTTVRIWLTAAGQPAAPPLGTGLAVVMVLLIGGGGTCSAALLLIICYRLGRVQLDRGRLIGWDAAWEATGPQWTSRA